MFKWQYGSFMPCFAPDTGADGGANASGGESDNGNVDAQTDTTDYKALYEKALADSKKLKASFDKTSSEYAELKKAQRESMTEQQRKEEETAEQNQRYREMVARVAEMETATLFAESGFDKKDYGDIATKIVEVGGEKAHELAESVIAFVQKANKSAVSNAQRGAMKDGARYPQTSTGTTTKTPYAEIASQNNQPTNRQQEIKDYYRKK